VAKTQKLEHQGSKINRERLKKKIFSLKGGDWKIKQGDWVTMLKRNKCNVFLGKIKT
jgi:hypothetical protein